MKKRIIAMGALFCALTSTVIGAGFQTLEQGAANIGNANAGATVNSNADASAAFWNPSSGFNAGLKVGETKLDAAASIVASTFDFTQTDANGNELTKSGDAGTVSVVPNFFLIHQFKEDILLSLSVTAPYALETDYDNGWVGSCMALHSNVTTIDVNPSIAFKVNDWLTVSGGVSAQWLHAKLTNAPFAHLEGPYAAYANNDELKITGDSWGVGGNIGFTINYAEDGRIGFQWRSEVSHTAKGSSKTSQRNQQIAAGMNKRLVGDVEADISTPHTFNIGWYQRLRGDLKKFAVMAEYSYTMWSCFEDLTVTFRDSNGTLSSQKEDWRNTSRVALGMHYYATDDLTLRFGTAWDQTPIDDDANRHARIPCTDRIWFTAGVGYKWNNWNFDLGYMYIWFYDDPKMHDEHSTAKPMYGYFEGRAHVASFQVGYKF
ncbi:MAG: outer membrane protein transport protein [Opitutales bacterium]|nr:outer membrane protein transport protein [Opitutales bacterium]